MQFRCPQCQNRLQIRVRPKHDLVRCPKCKGTVRLPPETESVAPAGGVDFSSLPSAPLSPPRPSPPPGASPPAAWQRPAYAQPQAPLPTQAPSFSASQTPAWSSSGSARTKKSSGTKILLILLGLGLGGLFLCCGGGGIFYVLVYSQRMVTVSAGGFSVDARGVQRKLPPPFEPGFGVQNLKTRSEFILVHVNRSDVNITPEAYLAGLRTQISLYDIEEVTRDGAKGIRYKSPGNSALPGHEAEIYPATEDVVWLVYAPGNEVLEQQGRPLRYDADTTRQMDDPEAFFNSFRRSP